LSEPLAPGTAAARWRMPRAGVGEATPQPVAHFRWAVL